MFMLPLFALLRRIAEPTPFLLPSFPPPEIFPFWGTSTAIPPSRIQKLLPTTTGRKYSIESSPNSFPSMTLTYLLFCIAPLTVTPPLRSPLIPPLFWEILQNLGSDHLPILQIIPLSPVFRPNERPLPLIFRKLAGMTLPFTLTLTVLVQKNTRFFPLLLLFSLF